MERPAISPRVGLFLGVLGVSLSSILVRLSSAPSLVLASYRLLFSVLILTPLVLLRHRRELETLVPKDFLLCGVGGILLALHFATWFESIKRTSIASSTVLVSTEVLFTAIGFALFLKGRIPKAGVAAILLAFAGSCAVALSDGQTGGASVTGNLLALGAAIFVAGYTLIGRVQRGHLSTTIYTWLTYCSCAATLLFMDIATGTPLWGWQVSDLLIGLLLAIFCTLLGHSVFSWSLKYIDPAFVAAAKLCEPVFATAIAAMLFAEIPKPVQLAGSALVLGGILLYTFIDVRTAKQR